MASMNLENRFLVLCSLSLFLIGGSQRTIGQEFQNLRRPAPNPVYHPVTLPNPPAVNLTPVPPRSHALAVRVLQKGEIVRGDTTFAGRIAGITGNLITLQPASGPAVTIGFAPPQNTVLAPRGTANGELTVNDVGSPFAADQEIWVSENNRLYAYFVWQTRRNAIFISLPDSAGQIMQEPTGNAVRLITQSGTFLVRSGQVKSFISRGMPYTLVLQTTFLQRPTWRREGDGSQKSFVLRAMVLAGQ